MRPDGRHEIILCFFVVRSTLSVSRKGHDIEKLHLYDKKKKAIIVNKSLISLLSSVPSITKKNRKKKMSNPVIHDFVASLFLFDEICTSQVFKKKIFTELKDFIEGRLIKNKDYFSNDYVFTSIYGFLKNIVDYLFENSL